MIAFWRTGAHVLVACCLLAACGASQATTHEVDPGPHDEASQVGCPATFGASPPSCTDGDRPGLCTYPEGSCSCAIPQWCGGAAPPPMPVQWICQRPPEPCPPVGTSCSGDGHCSSSPCGWGAGVACIGGVWTAEDLAPPP